MTVQDKESIRVPYLRVEHNGQEECFELDSNSNVLVGTGGHCKVQLEASNEVKSLHCILKLNNEGQLEVRDWNTGCTYVNDNVISEPAILGESDRLRVGKYQISAVLSDVANTQQVSEPVPEPAVVEEVADIQPLQTESASQEVEEVAEPAEPETELPKNDPVIAEGPAQIENSIDDEPIVDQSAPEFATSESATPLYDNEKDSRPALVEPAATADLDNGESGFVYDIDADFEDEANVAPFGFSEPSFGDVDPVDADEVQLLRLEVDQLRFELAQRDAKPKTDDLLDRQQTERLVSRLEELLDELKKSDSRTRELEELLRDSDQAANDEKEERKHLEKWISELETRVNQREEEVESENQQLKKHLVEARSLQQQTNERLQSFIEHKSSEGDAASSEIVDGLKEQINSLQQQLKSAHDEAEQARKQLEEKVATTPAEDVELLSGQKLAEIQLESSRERADLSRQRVELKKLRIELESRLEEPKEVNNADTRIQAMREHLKELHSKEQEEKQKRKDSGMTGRIANLLNRVTKQ